MIGVILESLKSSMGKISKLVVEFKASRDKILFNRKKKKNCSMGCKSSHQAKYSMNIHDFHLGNQIHLLGSLN